MPDNTNRNPMHMKNKYFVFARGAIPRGPLPQIRQTHGVGEIAGSWTLWPPQCEPGVRECSISMETAAPVGATRTLAYPWRVVGCVSNSARQTDRS